MKTTKKKSSLKSSQLKKFNCSRQARQEILKVLILKLADAFDVSGFYDFDAIKPRIIGTRSHILIFVYM